MPKGGGSGVEEGEDTVSAERIEVTLGWTREELCRFYSLLSEEGRRLALPPIRMWFGLGVRRARMARVAAFERRRR